MNTQSKIKEDLKNAMKSGNSFELSVLRMVITVLNNKGIEKRGKGQDAELTDEEVIDALAKEVKKRRESADIFNQAGREELAKNELGEVEIIKRYLPQEFSAEEIEKIVDKAIKETGAADVKDFGKVMGVVSKETKNKADSKVVSDIVKAKLGG